MSFDGAFASLIDHYVAMQGSVRSFLWRCVIRRDVRFVEWYLCRYARERSLPCMAMCYSTGRSSRWLTYRPLYKGAFAPLYGDVSFGGTFVSLIDTYVVMQGNVRFFVWRYVIQRDVRLVDCHLCRYARERSLFCMAMYHSTERSPRWSIFMSLRNRAFAFVYGDVASLSILLFEGAFAWWLLVCWSSLQKIKSVYGVNQRSVRSFMGDEASFSILSFDGAFSPRWMMVCWSSLTK